ncbi:hypothetical protein H2Y57_04890 [Pectobacterium aroidearum]|uniref:DUF4297 domain-containing protein n=1 Tax=Pectobacterium aroidearum TaxID=1201031 RepID=A0AAW3SR20_9GAMM|nr:hypothetical protein [Pectobacterium aroidearum]MBA5203031.1 hypothetical protein [Pectobacterium aroidearum]
MKKISDEQINIEAQSGYKPLTIDSGIGLLPFSELGDREFELLCYLLVKNEVECDKHKNITSISLMQGVSERGRDCSLYYNGAVSGLIQCKKLQGRMSRPQALREIIKFLLFSIIDSELLPEPDFFEYKLYVSNDLAETTNSLIHSYSTEIEKEIQSDTISKYTQDVVSEYETFKIFENNLPVTKIIELLKRINVTASNATDLTLRVHKNDSLLSLFFNVKTVIDLDSADKIIRNALDDYGLKYLTDEDLKQLQNRISRTKEENRINLGFVDFFGYNKEFFKFLKGEPFKEVLEAVASVTRLLDKYSLEFINSKINELTFENVTIKLLGLGMIHPFSVGVVRPYLFQRLSMKVLSRKMPRELVIVFNEQASLSKRELIDSIAMQLFDASERIMKGDFSHLVGNPEDIEFKKKIYAHIHRGFNSIEDAKLTFSRDIQVIMPTLDSIEGTINGLLQEERTVVIKDASFLDSDDEMKKIAKTLNMIESNEEA